MVDDSNAGTTRWRRISCSSRSSAGVLRFGEFKTKAGRLSPYFFNAGLFDDGAKLGPPGRILCAAPARLAASSST